MKKTLATMLSVILLFTLAFTVAAAQQVKLIVNGKTVTGVSIKSIKNVYYVPYNHSAKIFGISSSLHKASNSIIVGTGIEQAKKLKRGSTTRLIVNGKTIPAVSVPTIGNIPYIPLLKVAPALGAKVSVEGKSKTITITLKSKEQSESNPGQIHFPDNVTSVEKKALAQLSVKLKGGKLEIVDEWSSDLEIRALSIMDYDYKLSSPILIPNKYEGGLAIELNLFVNSAGSPFVPKDDETYFIKVVTNAGKITPFESHDPNVRAAADEKTLKDLNSLLGSAKFDSGKLVLDMSISKTYTIEKIAIDSEYFYTPNKPITISPGSQPLEVGLSEIKNASGQTFVPKKDGQWNLTHGVTISTNFGDVNTSASDQTVGR